MCGPWRPAPPAAPPRAGRPRRHRRRPGPRPRRPTARRRPGASRPLRRDRPPVPATVRPSAPGAAATQPTAAPWPSASRQSFVPASARASSPHSAPRAKIGGEERRRHQPAPDLLAEHGELDHAQPQAALVLGQLDRQPSLLRHGRPHGLVVALRRVRRGAPRRRPGAGKRADDRPRPDPGPEGVGPGHAVEERRRGVTQGLLVAREVEVHGGAVYGALTRVSPRAAAVPCCGGWICTPRPSRSRCGRRSGPG